MWFMQRIRSKTDLDFRPIFIDKIDFSFYIFTKPILQFCDSKMLIPH